MWAVLEPGRSFAFPGAKTDGDGKSSPPFFGRKGWSQGHDMIYSEPVHKLYFLFVSE